MCVWYGIGVENATRASAFLGHQIHRNERQDSPFGAGLTAAAVPGVVMAAKVTFFYNLWYVGQDQHLQKRGES